MLVCNKLATINAALSNNADILIYGCDVAAGEAGQAFVNALASATGSDIAASTDTTGSADLGGDWDLEAQTALVEAQALALTDWQGELAYSNTNNPVGTAWTISAPANTAVTPITLTNTTDGITTTVRLASSTANAWTFTGNETLNSTTIPFSNSAAGTDSFVTTFDNFGVGTFTGTITITFSQPVINPIIHLDKIGSNDGTGPITSISALFTLDTALSTAGASLTKLAGSPHLEVTGTTFKRTVGDVTSSNFESTMSTTTGTAAGSIQVNGTITTLTFVVSSSTTTWYKTALLVA